ncbi:hypothetical protein FB645_002718 [Coemansia sp. IMI 203386]|nr:hypothetical protein FB645_002718 [Coemansia sp. IMI 203386]
MLPLIPDTVVYPTFGINDSQTAYPSKNTLGAAIKSNHYQYPAMTSSTLSYASANGTNAQPQPSLIAPDIAPSLGVISTLSHSAAVTSSPPSSVLAGSSDSSNGDNTKLPQSLSSGEHVHIKGSDAEHSIAFQSQATSVNIDSESKTLCDKAGGGSTNGTTARLESSLLLKPYPIDCSKLNSVAASMDTPKSMQSGSENSTCISPLDMLIAALDPKKPHHPSTDATTAATLESSIPGSFWDSSMASSQDQYSNITWDTMSSNAASAVAAAAVAASANMNTHSLDASARPGILPASGGYQIDTLSECMAAGQQQQQGFSGIGHGIRRGSFPPGIKRPYSDFENLLSTADMYAATGNQLPMPSGSSAFSPHPHPSKHARHNSLISDASMTTAAMESAAAAAAAAAAASISYSTTAFPYSTKRSTVPLVSPSAGNAAHQHQQQNYFNTCFDSVSANNPAAALDSGMPLITGTPNIAHSHTRSLSLSSRPDHPVNILPQPPMSTPMSMQGMVSPMAAVAAAAAAAYQQHQNQQHQQSPGGFFYEELAMSGNNPHSAINSGVVVSSGGGLGTNGFMMTPRAIPSIPGVTVSPKEKPRRLSVPDFSLSGEGSDIDPKTRPRRQKLRFGGDLYTPMWVRNNGQQKEGFCDTCAPGKWLQLKNSAFWYHKQFAHGISSVSGRPFVRPLQVRHYDPDIIEGLCHQCQQWVPIANAKRRNSVLWFRHAHKCHVYHKPKQEEDAVDDDGSNAPLATSADQTTAAQPMISSLNEL